MSDPSPALRTARFTHGAKENPRRPGERPASLRHDPQLQRLARAARELAKALLERKILTSEEVRAIMLAPQRPGTQSPPLNAKETQAAIGRHSCRAKLLREFSKGPLTASEAAAAALQGENPTAPKFETYRKCVSE
jgi:hypothetical protein